MFLFPSVSENFRVEIKPALAFLAFSVLFLFLFLAEFHFGAEAMGTFQVGQQLLNVAPLGTREFHSFLLHQEWKSGLH
jgi:Na+-driven multidrug efflux pump